MFMEYVRTVNSGRSASYIGYEVNRLIANINSLKEIVSSNYEGQDAQIYFSAVEQLQRELKLISNDLENLGNRIINVADELNA